jgi:spermidine synthase
VGDPEGRSRSRPKSFRLEILLISFAAIALEIALTRVFSYKLYYYFTYPILGLALLGLGSGGVAVALFPRLRRVPPERLVALCALAGALAVPLAYALVARVQLNTMDLAASGLEWAKLAAICLALFAPFLLAGVSLATILGARPGDAHRLYFADLVGAGLGCALCVPLFATLTPPGVVHLAAAVLAAAGLLAALGAAPRLAWAALPLAALSGAVAAFPALAPEPVPDRIKSMSPQQLGEQRVLFSSWSPLFRVDVLPGFTPERLYVLAHDGIMGSTVRRFDGDLRALAAFDAEVTSLPFAVLPPGPDVLIIGAAGGHEILASLYFGARRVSAVELNPVTVSLLRRDLAAYSGRIAEHERVELVNAEGRSFVAADRRPRDLIWFVAPDSYSALNAASSGAFVLSESYLYTVEMIEGALERLAPGGILCAQFGEVSFERKPNRTTRYLATAREAFRRRGTLDFDRHVLLGAVPGLFTTATILLGREPFRAEQVERFAAQSAQVPGARVWHPAQAGGEVARHPVREVISRPTEELAAWLAAYPYAVTPVTDDSPFFWHFARFRDAWARPWGERSPVWDPEDATGERMLLVLLGFAAGFGALSLLLPLALARDAFREMPCKARAGLYFAALGLGFLFFEVCLIQRFTLFLGYPTYSLSVTLFALLVASGLGSWLGGRVGARRNRALLWLVAGLAALVAFYTTSLGGVFAAFAASALPARAAVAALLLLPLGLCLGAFLPLGLRTVAALGPRPREYVAWSWAVNGFFSVVSSVLATILSMTLGFQALLGVALFVYAVGAAAFSRVPEPRGAREPDPSQGARSERPSRTAASGTSRERRSSPTWSA